MSAPTPFRIAIPEADLDDLRARLARTRWPDEVNDDAWSHGTSRAFLQDLTAHWRHRFDWRAVETRLNRLPQFMLEIDGLPIHFIHAKGQGPRPMPLLISHGWPGSFLEMERILPLLTNPGAHGGNPADAFDVVIPSLPGFGFSARPAAPGCGPQAMAGLWAKLMTALGYEKFAVQGGDWGSAISAWLARQHPARVIGAHLNFLICAIRPAADAPFDDAERAYLAALLHWRDTEGGYFAIQSTRPQTLGYGLADSPAGLAAWIAEKFRTWSDCAGDIATAIPIDDLLANIAIYWFTNTITSSLRIYKEHRAAPFVIQPGERIAPPLGFAHFPREMLHPPRRYLERAFNLQHWTDMPRGGHFAAMEQPAALAADMRTFFRPLRP